MSIIFFLFKILKTNFIKKIKHGSKYVFLTFTLYLYNNLWLKKINCNIKFEKSSTQKSISNLKYKNIENNIYDKMF